jgi:hypothetical protein
MSAVGNLVTVPYLDALYFKKRTLLKINFRKKSFISKRNFCSGFLSPSVDSNRHEVMKV